MDRGHDTCMHYYDLGNQCMEESLLKRHTYSRAWEVYKYEAYLSTLCRRADVVRHQWCRPSFHRDDRVNSSKVLIILISIGMGRRWKVGYVSIIAHGWSGGSGSAIQFIYFFFTSI